MNSLINKIKEQESSPKVIKNLFSESEIKELGLSIGTGCREDNSFQLAAN